ncbi:MAG: 50S ribosomal protein L11 methyltransferase [Terrimicrobiaceae bacterium]
MSKPTHRWTRIAPAKWEDAWEERLRFLGPERLAIVTWPGSRSMKIEAYCDAKTARRLTHQFGGRAALLPKDLWSGAAQAPRRPLSIRGKLKIFSDEAQWQAWERPEPNRSLIPEGVARLGDPPGSCRRYLPKGLLIPAGMAFGTGDHATTGTCLRILCDLARDLPRDFETADLGTGTGILAIAAKFLGAGNVFALDNDPAAVRVAKANARKNRCPTINVAKGSVLDWSPHISCHLVIANLYSDLLIAAAPVIARGLRSGGSLIFSGVLQTQVDEVSKTLRREGFKILNVVNRGKWCAGLAAKKTSI